jgi:predicted porin
VTLSGSYGVGFQKSTANVKGMKTTDGSLTAVATEDLGGGLKATAKVSMDLQGRGQGTPAATDASLTVAGDFGSVLAGSIEAGNGIIGNGMGGAPVSLPSGVDGLVLSGAGNVDIVKWTSPAMNGFTVSASATDIAGEGSATGAKSQGLGFGYAAGALTVGGDFTKYSNTNVAAGTDSYTVTGGASNAVTTTLVAGAAAKSGADQRVRLSASYDLGMVKLGAGYQTISYNDNAKNKQTVVGFSVPMGALTLGAAVATNNQVIGAGQTQAQKKVVVYGANYALSKRTTVNFSAANAPTKGLAAAAVESQYRVKMVHAF